MMNLSLNNLFLFLLITWGTNIGLNLLYVLKKAVPKLRAWDMLIDRGVLFFDGRRLLGDSTTTFGLIVVALCSFIAFYSSLFSHLIALCTPFLVYLGHMIGSFIKRRMNKQETFVPFIDHGDYILVSGSVLGFLGAVSWPLAITTLLVTYVLHPLATLCAFKLKLRKYYF